MAKKRTARTTPGNEEDDDMTFERVEKGVDDGELEDEANEAESEKDEVYVASDTTRSYALRQKPASRQNDGELATDGAFDVEDDDGSGKRRSDDAVRKRRALKLKAAKADFKYSAAPAEIYIEEPRFADTWHLIEAVRRFDTEPAEIAAYGLAAKYALELHRRAGMDVVGLSVGLYMPGTQGASDYALQRSESGSVMLDGEGLTVDRKKGKESSDGETRHDGGARTAKKSNVGSGFDVFRDDPAAQRKSDARLELEDIEALASLAVSKLARLFFTENAKAEDVGFATGVKSVTTASSRGTQIAKLYLDAVRAWCVQKATNASYRDILGKMPNDVGVPARRLKVLFKELDAALSEVEELKRVIAALRDARPAA